MATLVPLAQTCNHLAPRLRRLAGQHIERNKWIMETNQLETRLDALRSRLRDLRGYL